MAPFLVLVVVTVIARTAGFDDWPVSLRAGFAAMLLLTASAHWGKRRPDLIRMVPAGFPRPDAIVTATGVLELLGAAGLLIPATAPAAAVCLAVLFVAMFPANVRAAQQKLSIAGRPVTPLAIRAPMQAIFIAGVLWAGFGG